MTMSIVPSSPASKLAADFDDTFFYQTQSELMSVREHLHRDNQCIKEFSNKNSTERKGRIEPSTVLHFCVDANRITEARYFISTICKDKLILMRIEPDQRSTIIRVELIIEASIVQPVKNFMKLRFNC